MADFPKLFIPGPTHVSDEILDSFKTPQIGHRTSEISELISGIVDGIQNSWVIEEFDSSNSIAINS